MTRRWALLLLPLVASSAVLGGARAAAQQTPTTLVPYGTTTTTTTAADAPELTTTTVPVPAASPDGSETADEVQAIFTGPQFGDYPDNHYLYYTGSGSAKLTVPDVPGPLDDIAKGIGVIPSQVDTQVPTDRSASAWFADLGWSIGQACATIIRSLVHWLYTFGFIRVLSPIVSYIAGILNGIAVGPLNLANVLWVVTGAALAWRLITNRRFASFFADLGIALVLFIAAGMLMTKPAVIFDGVANLAGDIAQLPFAAIGGDPGGADAEKGLTQAETALKEVWTVAPWEVTNFGHTLTGRCQEAGQAIVRNGPYSKTSDTPRKVMLAAGCKSEANYNNDSTPKRTAILFLLGLAGAAAAAFILAMAWGFARAVVRLGRDVVVGGYALFFAMTPWSHDVAWSWGRDVQENALAVIVPSWVLGGMLVADVLILRLPGIPLGAQAFPMLVVNVGVFHQRRKIVNKVAAKLSGGVNRVHARVANVDAAKLDERRRQQGQSRGVQDMMPGSKLVTVPLVAGAVGVGRQLATGGKHVRKVRSVATAAAGPAGAAVKATKAGAAMTTERVRTAKTDVAGVAQDVSAKTSARAAEYRAKRDARRGQGTAPLGDVHGPAKPPPPPPAPPPGLVPSGPPPPAAKIPPPPPAPSVESAA